MVILGKLSKSTLTGILLDILLNLPSSCFVFRYFPGMNHFKSFFIIFLMPNSRTLEIISFQGHLFNLIKDKLLIVSGIYFISLSFDFSNKQT